MKWLLSSLACLSAALGYPAQALGPRAAALDYCADQYLLALADDAQIVGVSPVAAYEVSYLRERAKAFRTLRPNAEEIATARPDIVLRFWGGAPRLSEFLETRGVAVVTLDYASDFEGVRLNIRRAATALAREAQGEALIAAMDERLAALARRPLYKTAALYATPGGVTAGKQTMIDAIFTAAQVPNAAAEAGLSYWPSLPAETLVTDPPALIVAGFFDTAGERANHWSMARHPAIARVFAATPTLHLRPDVLSCPAWFAVDAAEEIAAGIDRLEAGDGG